MLYLLIFISGFVLALFSTPYVITQLVKHEIVDLPGERKWHKGAIPRMGGIVIYLISVILFLSYSSNTYSIKFLVLCSVPLLACGILDDIKDINWRVKFFIQIFVAGGMIYFIGQYINAIQLFGFTIGYPYDYIIMLIFIVGVFNSMNLMDGMDGLVSGFSLISFSVIFGLAFADNNGALLVLTAALAGSTLGFFKYNYYPARVFLGDTGSLTLGFFLVLCSMLLVLKDGNQILNLTFAVILLGVPIVDTFKVMIVRLLKRHNPFLPDRNHLHHVIFGCDVNHKTTVFIIHAFSFSFTVTAVYYVKISHHVAIAAFAFLSLLLISAKFLIRKLSGTFVKTMYVNLRDSLPQYTINFYKRFFVPLSILVISFLFFFIMPGRTEIRHEFIFLFIIASIVLFVIFIYQNFQSKLFNEVYVLINIAVFFALSNISHPFITSLHINYLVLKNIVTITLAVLVLLILFFIMVRERWFGMKVSFLSKYDIGLLILVSIVVVFQDYISYPKFYSVSGKLIFGFIAYLTYKIIAHFSEKISRLFLYLTFAFTLITFISMYLA
jgi:UDP-GlcNAc:undecaprenyl-phosphate GlcNAc-1-phosphate transferase